MWPKLLAQMFELLPHISRLVPMLDRYFSSKAASEKANEAALAAMAEGVRGDLGQVTRSHAGLYRQLQDLSAQVFEVGDAVKQARSLVEAQEHRVGSLELQVAAIGRWVKTGVALLVVLVGMMGWVMLAHRR